MALMADSPNHASPHTPAAGDRPQLPLLAGCSCGPGCSCGCQSGGSCQCGGGC
ncbi:hypothetical protein AB0G35_19005 [Streptomyces sp. NPDC021749]|uniref:hypothetical protein n=1 Tax=Streptomyces sp. NPDC021749 TaxID=3154905 RepID=UPI00340ADD41